MNDSAAPTRVRYLVVGLTTTAAVLLYLHRICLSFTERFIVAELGLTNEEASWLLSAFFWTYALAQVPCGWLSDRYGARTVLAGYIVGWSICTGLMGLAQSFLALLIFRLGCGIAQAGAYPTSAALVSRWVPFSARAFASAIVSTGGRIGGFLAPLLTAHLMVALDGWRPVMIVYGLIGVAAGVGFWLGARNHPRDHPGCNGAELALIEGGHIAATAPVHHKPEPAPWGPMLRSGSLWLSSISQFFTNLAWVFLITWFPRYLAEVHDVPVKERGLLASLPILIGMAGMLAGGWITDELTRRLGLRWGRGLPMALTRFVGTAAFAVCPLFESSWTVTAALCMSAAATDLGVPAVWAYMQDVGGRHVGAILGWGNMWGNLGAALSPIVLQKIVGTEGHWNACFLACAASFAVAGVAALGVDATVPIVPPNTEDAGRSQ